jgi:hypothetical protein
LQWSYVQDEAYSVPTGFKVFFPASAPVPVVVPYNGETFPLSYPIGSLANNMHYTWKVVPYYTVEGVDFGAEEEEIWSFYTEMSTPPSQAPTLIYPTNHAPSVPPENLTLQWRLPGGVYQIDSFFDIYCDVDPDFHNPPIFSGHIDPSTRTDNFQYTISDLEPLRPYNWCVRYSNFVDYWTSAAWGFTAGGNLVNWSTISGTISGNYAVNGVTVSCPGAAIPNQVVTPASGFFSFSVRNGFGYSVTPTKQGYYFNDPAGLLPPTVFQLVNANQVANFTILKPNVTFNPWPATAAEGVIINIPHLQWEFAAQNGYDVPYQYEIYFPHYNPNELTVEVGGRSFFDCILPTLQYNTTYTWKVIPRNQYGVAVGVQIWSFTTELEPVTVAPILISPTNGGACSTTGVDLVWSHEDCDAQSFFDVFLGTGGLWSYGDLVYSGPGIPQDLTHFVWHCAELMDQQTYYWFVRYSNAVDHALDRLSEVWTFVTPPPTPELLAPQNGAEHIASFGSELDFQLSEGGGGGGGGGAVVQSFFDIYLEVSTNLPPEPEYADLTNLSYNGTGIDLYEGGIYTLHNPPLQSGKKYYWYVKLTSEVSGLSSYSSLWSFTTEFAPPPAPELIAPPNGAQDVPPEGAPFVWGVADNDCDSFFDIYIEVSGNAPSTPKYSGTGAELYAEGFFTFNQAVLLDEEAYYWFVRFTDLRNGQYTDSPTWTFTTGNIVLPTAVIGGTIMNYGGTSFNVNGITVANSGGGTTATVSSGYFSFTVNKGFSYTVTPLPSSWYHFVPTSYTFNNVQSDSTHNFYIVSNKPNLANFIWPADLMINVPVMTGSLQWEYYQIPGYSLPDCFDVWFGPAGECLPLEEVSYSGDGIYDTYFPQAGLYPLEYYQDYEWKVVPRNEEGGEAEGVETWTFTTAPPPVPELLTPVNGATDVPPEGVYLVWQIPDPSYPADSFFDIYVDIDPDFPNPPMFTGQITPSRYEFQYFTGELMEEAVYYCKVRCSAFGQYWTSAVHNFWTGNSQLITYSKIDVTITPGGNFGANGVTVSCPTAAAPRQQITGAAGTCTFWVANGATHTVTPTKQFYWFQPVSQTFNLVQANQVANFTMNSLKPNVTFQPWPGNLAYDVTINIPHLQWEFAQQAGYDLPYEFHIYFPDYNPTYVSVAYSGGRQTYQIQVPHSMPLDYNTTYTWKVVPWNPQGGDAENVPIWEFTTEEQPLPPDIPLCIYPFAGATNVDDSGLIMEWGPPPSRDGRDWAIDSFFDVWTEVEGEEAVLIYEGPGLTDPHNPSSRFCYAPDLLLNTNYNWWVMVTDPESGMSAESDHNFFSIRPTHLAHFCPALTEPAEGEEEVPPDNMDFKWWIDVTTNSFFDIYCDTSLDPTNNIVRGYWNILRTYFEWHCSALMAEETYYWFVRYSNFVDHWYSKSPVGQFMTGPPSINTFPWTETFEGTTFPPTGWTRYDLDGGGTQWTSSTAHNHTTGGTKSALHAFSTAVPNPGQNGWLVTPPITLSASRSFYGLGFWNYNVYPNWMVYNGLWVTTDDGDPATSNYTELWAAESATEAWSQAVANLTPYAGQTIHLGFKYTGYDADDWYLDDVGIYTDDVFPPIVTHLPLLNSPRIDIPYTVSADIVDDNIWNNGISSAYLYYSIDSGGFTQIAMTPGTRSQMQGDIPPQPLNTAIDYYIVARDASPALNETTSGTYTFNVEDPTWLWYDSRSPSSYLGSDQVVWGCGNMFANPFYGSGTAMLLNTVDGLCYNAATPHLHVYSFDGENLVDLITPPLPVTFAARTYRTVNLTAYDILIDTPYFFVTYEDFPIHKYFALDEKRNYHTSYLLQGGGIYSLDDIGYPGAWMIGANVQSLSLEAPVVTIYLDEEEVTLSWAAVDYAHSYKVYGSDDPYAEPFPEMWTQLTTTDLLSYTYPEPEGYQFFKVTADIAYLPTRAKNSSRRFNGTTAPVINVHVNQAPKFLNKENSLMQRLQN